jgi:hypothetical protein
MSARPVVAAAAAALAAGTIALLLAGAGDDGSPGGRTAAVTVDARHGGRVVPRSFLGLSIEWDSVVPYTGPRAGRRAALLRVLAPLERAAGSPLRLRIGGDTADQAWFNPDHRARPPTVLQDVGPATLDAIAWLAGGLGGPVTLGLNLALADPGNAARLARAAQRRLPPGALAAVEIGNEPDLYTHARTFRRGGHLHRRVRKRTTYGPAAYGRDVDAYLPRLRAALGPDVRMVVGGTAGPGWWPALPALLRRWHGRADVVAAHLYALPSCEAATPGADWLMSPAASRDRVATLAPLQRIARRARLPLQVAELNSAACGGRPGLTDTPAAALWLTDTLFALLAQGAQAADVHTWRGAAYAPFVVDGTRGAVARPPLDGMLAFARAAPSGSRLVPASVRGGDGLRAWATVDRRGVQRVALLAPRRAAARVSLGARDRRCGRLWRDRGRGATGVCSSRGAYAVRLPGRSVAVLTVPPGR